MVSETPQLETSIRALTQSIANHMLQISDQIAETPDPLQRDELLSVLILLQGSLALLSLGSFSGQKFFLQRAADLLRNH
jgi:hypothetical protein